MIDKHKLTPWNHTLIPALKKLCILFYLIQSELETSTVMSFACKCGVCHGLQGLFSSGFALLLTVPNCIMKTTYRIYLNVAEDTAISVWPLAKFNYTWFMDELFSAGS